MREVEKQRTEPTPAPTDGEEPVVPPPRDPSRPAVGTVIALPPRIKITERTPSTGRPAPVPPSVIPPAVTRSWLRRSRTANLSCRPEIRRVRPSARSSRYRRASRSPSERLPRAVRPRVRSQ